MAGFSLTFLGTGTSVGIPVIGCTCPVCVSQDPRNQRLRSSVLVRAGGLHVLVDSGPDLRAQALREGLGTLDAVLYTHAHLDHVAGFDELRAFCWHRAGPLPLHATPSCMDVLRQMYGWAFAGHGQRGYVNPDPRTIHAPFEIGDLRVTPLPVEHASVETIGFLFEYPRHRSIAYLPDVKRIPDDTLRLLRRAGVLVVDALRPAEHPTHFSLAEALDAIERSRVDEAWLTHLSHENDHDALQATLPTGVSVAWDGLTLEL